MLKHAQLIMEATIMSSDKLIDPVLTIEDRCVLRNLIEARAIEKDTFLYSQQNDDCGDGRDLDDVPLEIIRIHSIVQC